MRQRHVCIVYIGVYLGVNLEAKLEKVNLWCKQKRCHYFIFNNLFFFLHFENILQALFVTALQKSFSIKGFPSSASLNLRAYVPFEHLKCEN